MRTWRRVAVLTLVAMLAACSGDGGPAPVVMGSGEIPPQVRDDVPVPSGAVIGATMVDEGRGRIELNLRVPEAADTVAAGFADDLTSAGYEVSSPEEGAGDRIAIEARRGTMVLAVDVRPSSDDTTEVFVIVEGW